MNYQFFIQGTDNGQPDPEFRFIMVLDTSDRDSLAQTSIQALITRHQMHTCVNIPFRYKDGYTMRFKTAYADMDGEPHPVLVILTNKYGAFRLPFPAGEEGFRLYRKTYKEVKLRLMEHRNRTLKRLSSEPVHARRIEAPKARQPNREAAQEKPAPNAKPKQASAQVPKKAPGNRRSKTPPPKSWWSRQPESLRWLVGGLAAGLAVASVLFTGSAFAGDQVPTSDTTSAQGDLMASGETQDDIQTLEAEVQALGANIDDPDAPYAGFPVPKMVKAPQAQVIDGCSIPQASSAGGAEFALPGLTQPNPEI